MTRAPAPPVVLAYGLGVDSTAMLVELVGRGEPPDLVLTADTGSEKPASYDYLAMIRPWLDTRGVLYVVVRYRPRRFKHYPPYYSLLENLLTNATLPSIAMGRHSCSLKWKVAPQDAYLRSWPPAQAAWSRGQKVIRLIGYDASPADSRRHAHAEGLEHALFECRYPLREWGWDRAACIARIKAEGLPVPVKSSCFFCTGMTTAELRELPDWCLRVIVLIEARAAPRLRTVEGLWQRSTKARPGRMTDFIRRERLLPEAAIDAIVADAPTDLIRFQDVAAGLPVDERAPLAAWLDRFLAGAASLAT